MFFKSNPSNEQPGQVGGVPAGNPNMMPTPGQVGGVPAGKPNVMPAPGQVGGAPAGKPNVMPAPGQVGGVPAGKPNVMPMPGQVGGVPAGNPNMMPMPGQVGGVPAGNPNMMPMPGQVGGVPAMPYWQHPCLKPEMLQGQYQSMYPDMYYKIQPHVLMACDEMDAHGVMMPTNQMMGCMVKHIYDNVCKMYPDMANYGQASPATAKGYSAMEFIWGTPAMDIIGILLLAEFFRRRRRYY